jgi:hypothetical protein
MGQLLREVEIDIEFDPKVDPVSSNSNNRDSLRKHHRSILEAIQYRLGDGSGGVSKLYVIENNWTMKAEDTVGALQRLRGENGDGWKKAVASKETKARF